MSESTHVFAVPGEDSVFDEINPTTGRSRVNGLSLEEIRLREGKAGIVVMSWDKFLSDKAARQNTPVAWLDCTEEEYDEMLNILPPAAWTSQGFLVGEPYDHCAATGKPRFSAYWRRSGQYQKSNRPLTLKEFNELTGEEAEDLYVY